MNNLTLTQKIHQMFILGYEGPNPLSDENSGFIEALKNGLGGVIFFTKNITDRAAFQKSVLQIKENALIKPFLSIDQEGGRVERTLNLYKGPQYLCARESARKGEKFVEEQTRNIAFELQSFGLNMNFAPVLDVDTNPDNPIIAERAFSSNADDVTRFGKIAAETYLQNGILPVGKHFPGHGDTFVDSHKAMPEVNLSFDELEKTHIKPFNDLLDIVPALMVAHVHYTAFDAQKIPASVSNNVINQYLRKKLGYKGLIISDDMVMGGIKGFTSFEACVKGINAGINMFIFRNSDNPTLELIKQLETAAEKGVINLENIDKSVALIAGVKNKVKCF